MSIFEALRGLLTDLSIACGYLEHPNVDDDHLISVTKPREMKSPPHHGTRLFPNNAVRGHGWDRYP